MEGATNFVSTIAEQRAQLGANISRAQSELSQMQIESESLSNAVSRIQDADVAETSTALAKSQILINLGMQMTAQTTHIPKYALSLLINA